MFRGVPVSAQIEFWRHPDTKLQREAMGIPPFFILGFLLLGVFPMWIGGVIPSFQPNALFYAVIYYFVYIPVLPMNAITSFQRIPSLYLFAFFLNWMAWALMSYMLGVILYQFITCIQGTQPLSCRDDQWVQLLLAILTFFIWLLQLLICGANTLLLVRMRHVERTSRIIRNKQ